MNKTDKKIEHFIHEFLLNFDINRVKDRVQHEYVEGTEAEERVKNYLKEELTNLLNTEVQKAKEEAVRGFAKWCDDNDMVYLEGFVSHWAKRYLQSLDGDGE